MLTPKRRDILMSVSEAATKVSAISAGASKLDRLAAFDMDILHQQARIINKLVQDLEDSFVFVPEQWRRDNIREMDS